jgi:hypothetical protein
MNIQHPALTLQRQLLARLSHYSFIPRPNKSRKTIIVGEVDPKTSHEFMEEDTLVMTNLWFERVFRRERGRKDPQARLLSKELVTPWPPRNLVRTQVHSVGHKETIAHHDEM